MKLVALIWLGSVMLAVPSYAQTKDKKRAEDCNNIKFERGIDGMAKRRRIEACMGTQ
jgi:hypothetical protein